MYFPPYEDATGLHIPTLTDIQDYLIQQFLSIYGQTIVLTNDSADMQWIKILSLMINDAFNTAQLANNAKSPATAIGADLDTVVKINGITRKSATQSQVVLTLTGAPNTPIVAATVKDINNFFWDIPNTNLGVSGSVNVTAICETSGAITALPGTINTIITPIAGWTGVTNPSAAIPGAPDETDSQLRGRQALSVSLSAKTLVDSTISGIASVPGVTRYATVGVENPTGSVDSYGNPPHSISMVVEGGTDLAVATAIYNNKTPGCLTNGTTTIIVTDPFTFNTMNISFFRPTYIRTYVTLNIHPLSTSYNSATQSAIILAVFNYLNSLQIGETLTVSALYAIAMSVTSNLSLPYFSIKALFVGTAPSPSSSNDIVPLFNQVIQGVNISDIVINIV